MSDEHPDPIEPREFAPLAAGGEVRLDSDAATREPIKRLYETVNMVWPGHVGDDEPVPSPIGSTHREIVARKMREPEYRAEVESLRRAGAITDEFWALTRELAAEIDAEQALREDRHPSDSEVEARHAVLDEQTQLLDDAGIPRE